MSQEGAVALFSEDNGCHLGQRAQLPLPVNVRRQTKFHQAIWKLSLSNLLLSGKSRLLSHEPVHLGTGFASRLYENMGSSTPFLWQDLVWKQASG